MKPKKHRCPFCSNITILIVCCLMLLSPSCSQESSYLPSSNTSNGTNTLNNGERAVTLITGADDSVEWSIKMVDRVDRYYTPSMDMHEGRAVVIKGEANSNCKEDCDFFVSESMTFSLTDVYGSQFKLQAPIVELYRKNGKTVALFTVFFSLEQGDITKFDTTNWGNFIIQDATEKNRNLPDHMTNLSIFDQVA